MDPKNEWYLSIALEKDRISRKTGWVLTEMTELYVMRDEDVSVQRKQTCLEMSVLGLLCGLDVLAVLRLTDYFSIELPFSTQLDTCRYHFCPTVLVSLDF